MHGVNKGVKTCSGTNPIPDTFISAPMAAFESSSRIFIMKMRK